MQNREKEILVYFDSDEPVFIGTLRCAIVRGKEIFSFNASNDYIKNEAFRFLDPDLGQFSGSQYLRSEKTNFGMFLDSAPDRWGRLLLRRREAIIAKKENRQEKTLLESDYLLGVFDGNRMGALRFKTQTNDAFLDNNADLEELWRRLVFSIAVSNSDCHLRNHAFILNENKTWSLTPAYDMNPDPYSTGLALNVNENSNSLDFDLALDVAPFFRIDAKTAKEILQHIKKNVAKWQQIAAKFKISKKEMQKMELAFFTKGLHNVG
ncbi:MAG: HipA domain-containing protein [Fibromonadales bacterium]|nr:HipA domain-containing protein [Fibromonadales bacterium]